ncbi:hypothetical protein DFH08DRAFT_824476 [Mycena albidolilacea]|uniref:Uncharacterized protein n=1 Tax=Mycena albidolilacea TaxID=1033008 RepID=A0AAD7EAW8_9AGAR|nr:hypothetical protein DFH08DRAFT_824476 [Mycena albidolilacea]
MDPALAASPIVQVAKPLALPTLFQWVLFGVLSVQDPWAIKCLVYSLYTLLVVETVLLTHDAFQRFTYGFADFEALITDDLGWFEVPIMSGPNAVECFGSCWLLIWHQHHGYSHTAAVEKPNNDVKMMHIMVDTLIKPLMSLTSTVGAILTGGFTFQDSLSHLKAPIWHSTTTQRIKQLLVYGIFDQYVLLFHTVKYRFPTGIRRRGKYRNPDGEPNPYTGSEGAWLQLVRCALLYTWCPISERDSEEDGSPRRGI